MASIDSAQRTIMGLGPLTLPPPPSPGLAVHRSPSKRAEIMLRKKTERKEKEEDFDVGMRNSAMEFDAMGESGRPVTLPAILCAVTHVF